MSLSYRIFVAIGQNVKCWIFTGFFWGLSRLTQTGCICVCHLFSASKWIYGRLILRLWKLCLCFFGEGPMCCIFTCLCHCPTVSACIWTLAGVVESSVCHPCPVFSIIPSSVFWTLAGVLESSVSPTAQVSRDALFNNSKDFRQFCSKYSRSHLTFKIIHMVPQCLKSIKCNLKVRCIFELSYFSTPHMLQDQLCWQCLTQLGQSCRPQIVPKVGWNGDDAFMLWKVCVVLSFEASACLLSSEGQSSKSLHFGDVETTSQHCRRSSSASHSVLVESVLFRGNVIGGHGVIAVDWDPNRNKTKESRQVREMILGKRPKYMKLNKNFW